jgi:pilus assembly protein CpaC
VSQPLESLGVDVAGFKIPSFDTRRASTGVDLGDGESFAIAGLLREDIEENIQEFPFLGDIPVLGWLFRSTSFRKEETELVVIVTPHLVKPLPPGPPALPTDNFVEPNAAEFFLLGSLEAVFGKETKTDDPSADPSAPLPEAGPKPDDPVAGDFGHRVEVWGAEKEQR